MAGGLMVKKYGSDAERRVYPVGCIYTTTEAAAMSYAAVFRMSSCERSDGIRSRRSIGITVDPRRRGSVS